MSQIEDATHAAPAHTERDARGRLVVRSHAAVVAIANDPAAFSNNVSAFRQVPNGLDGHEHAAMRRLLDPFFSASEVATLEPGLAKIATQLVSELRQAGGFDAVTDLGARFAVRAQSEWLGWPHSYEDPLLAWMVDHRAAVRSGDAERITRAVSAFDAMVHEIIHARRQFPNNDVTSRLLALRDESGQALTDDDLASVLRNWTGGDLASLSLCVGVIVHWLATHQDHYLWFRTADDNQLDAAIDEILRIDDPFIANRRRANRETEVDGCPVAAGDLLLLDWRSANRDPKVFSNPDGFEAAANADKNLVWGIGPHVCPGRPLATCELRVVIRAVLDAGRVNLDERLPPVREEPPVAGFRTVPVFIRPA